MFSHLTLSWLRFDKSNIFICRSQQWNMTVAKKSLKWWFWVRVHTRNHWYRDWRDWHVDLLIDAGDKVRTICSKQNVYTWEWTRVSEDSWSIQENTFSCIATSHSCSCCPCKPETKQGIVKTVCKPKRAKRTSCAVAITLVCPYMVCLMGC